MHVRQAANVVELLEYFARRQRPATLAEIADDLGWPRSSTFNLVGTLADKGFFYEPYGRRGYYPSPRWLGLVQKVAEAEPIPEAVLAAAAEVARLTGETTLIGASADVSASFVHVIESSHAIRYFAQLGDRVPIQASAIGRALLAQATPSERKSLYRRIAFERYSGTTPVSIEAVEAELQAAAVRGYQQSNCEYLPELGGVAIPLELPDRRLSLGVAGPISRIGPQRAAIAGIVHGVLQRHGLAGATIPE